MKPKEKAQELIDKFMNIQGFINVKNETYLDVDEAKQCAIICVDEFLSFQENLYLTEGSLAYQYWQEVKKELEK